MRVFFILNESTRNIMPSAEFSPFFSLLYFFFFVSFLIVCVCVFLVVLCVCTYLLYPSTSKIACYHIYIQNIHSLTHSLARSFIYINGEALTLKVLPCIRFTSWKIKNNLFTVICMYCCCVHFLSFIISISCL